MGLAQDLKSIWEDKETVVTRPAETYTTAIGAYDLFDIIGGAVEITQLGAITTGAAVGAVDVRLTINGVNTDIAVCVISGAVGQVFYSSLNAAGTALQAAALPITVVTRTTMISGIQPLLANGVIVATFVAGTSFTGQFWVVYRALSEGATIRVA